MYEFIYKCIIIDLTSWMLGKAGVSLGVLKPYFESLCSKMTHMDRFCANEKSVSSMYPSNSLRV